MFNVISNKMVYYININIIRIIHLTKLENHKPYRSSQPYIFSKKSTLLTPTMGAEYFLAASFFLMQNIPKRKDIFFCILKAKNP